MRRSAFACDSAARDDSSARDCEASSCWSDEARLSALRARSVATSSCWRVAAASARGQQRQRVTTASEGAERRQTGTETLELALLGLEPVVTLPLRPLEQRHLGLGSPRVGLERDKLCPRLARRPRLVFDAPLELAHLGAEPLALAPPVLPHLGELPLCLVDAAERVGPLGPDALPLCRVDARLARELGLALLGGGLGGLERLDELGLPGVGRAEFLDAVFG